MPVHKKYNRNVKTNALGRGLDALISTESVSTQGSSTINEVPLQQSKPTPTSHDASLTPWPWRNWPAPSASWASYSPSRCDRWTTTASRS